MRTFLLTICLSLLLLGGDVYLLSGRPLSKSEKKLVEYIKRKYKVFIPKGQSFQRVTRRIQLKYRIRTKQDNIVSKILHYVNNIKNNRKLGKDDYILIFSDMLYKKEFYIGNGNEEKIKIDFDIQLPGDGFITSPASPFREMLDRGINISKLGGAKVFIFTKGLDSGKKKKHIKRFYHFFFKKLNADLVYFDNDTCTTQLSLRKCETPKKYFRLGNYPEKIYAPLKEVGLLQYIDLKDSGKMKNIRYDLAVSTTEW